MAEDTNRVSTTIGMFDFFKGVGILGIIFFHTISLYDFRGSISGNMFTDTLMGIGVIVCVLLIPAFFVATGYGFRVRPVKLCIKQQLQLILKPYIIIMFITTVLHLIIHYSFFRYLKGSLNETLNVLTGMILALPENIELNGRVLFSCGPAWYLFAMMIGWILLDIILNITSSKISWIIAIVVAFLGVIIGEKGISYLCIPQGMIVTIYIYMGYYAKKNKLVLKKTSWIDALLIVICTIISIVGYIQKGQMDIIASSIWNYSIISVISDGILGLYFLKLVCRIKWKKNVITKIIEEIGRDSLLFFAVHTVEMKAIPWYLYSQKLTNHVWAGLVSNYIIRLVIIYGSAILVKRIIRRVRRAKK